MDEHASEDGASGESEYLLVVEIATPTLEPVCQLLCDHGLPATWRRNKWGEQLRVEDARWGLETTTNAPGSDGRWLVSGVLAAPTDAAARSAAGDLVRVLQVAGAAYRLELYPPAERRERDRPLLEYRTGD